MHNLNFSCEILLNGYQLLLLAPDFQEMHSISQHLHSYLICSTLDSFLSDGGASFLEERALSRVSSSLIFWI